MSNDFLEFLNLYLVEMDAILVVVCAIYLAKRYAHNGYGGYFLSDYGVRMAIGLSLLTTGHGIIRGSTWAWRFFSSHGYDYPENKLIPLFGLAVITMGMLILIHQISEVSKPWLWAVVIPGAITISALFAWGI